MCPSVAYGWRCSSDPLLDESLAERCGIGESFPARSRSGAGFDAWEYGAKDLNLGEELARGPANLPTEEFSAQRVRREPVRGAGPHVYPPNCGDFGKKGAEWVRPRRGSARGTWSTEQFSAQ
jgi:hypothetical protein